MITLERIGTLDVSAASGAVFHGGLVHVVADDGLSLHSYATDGSPRRVVRLFEGSLPEEASARKRAKPDLEALALLPGDALLAIGSGSTALRMRGALVRGDVARSIDLAPLFAELSRHFEEPNVEGLVVLGDELVLAQRGNGKKRENALVRLDLSRALAELEQGVLTAAPLVRIDRVALGTLGGVPLSITDLAAREGTLYFSAAAEDTDDPYLDAPCAGSVVGAFDADAKVAFTEEVSPKSKIEGLTPLDSETFLLVADADDPAVMAPLFRARISRR